MVIKGFVTLGLITRLDDMFAASFPGELKENAEALSDSGVLKMEQDNNTTGKVFKRFCRSITETCSYDNGSKRIMNEDLSNSGAGLSEKDRIRQVHKAMKEKIKEEEKRAEQGCLRAFTRLFLDLLINLTYSITTTLLIVFFNYFGGILVIFVQMLGFYYMNFMEAA